jgi:death-on-curing protein
MPGLSGASHNDLTRGDIMATFLTLDEVLAIHAEQIERYGGSLGIRDHGLLESALAMPEATYADEELHSTLYEKAAAYLFHLVKNHPFVDGNKRIALAVALIFLAMNDIRIEATDDELVDTVLGAAEGRISKAEIAVFLDNHSR